MNVKEIILRGYRILSFLLFVINCLHFKPSMTKMIIEAVSLITVIGNESCVLGVVYIVIAFTFYDPNLNIPIGICIGYIITLLVLKDNKHKLDKLQSKGEQIKLLKS